METKSEIREIEKVLEGKVIKEFKCTGPLDLEKPFKVRIRKKLDGEIVFGCNHHNKGSCELYIFMKV